MNTRRDKLLQFVKEAHGDQRRKYTDEPYYTHLENVYNIAKVYCKDLLLYECCICHDILEDTNVDKDELGRILHLCGYDYRESMNIIYTTLELTDRYTKENYPNHNRKDRKFMEAVRLGDTSELAQTVKYADLIDNLRDIIPHDEGFARVYVEEKKQLLQLMRQGNFDLYLQACAELYNAIQQLKV